MAITTLPLAVPSGYSQYQDTNVGATVNTIKATGATLFSMVIDNTSNTAITYVKFFFVAAGSVTLGTTGPDWIVPIPSSKKITVPLPDGPAYPTALSYAAVTTNGTAGTTAPTNPVVLTVLYT